MLSLCAFDDRLAFCISSGSRRIRLYSTRSSILSSCDVCSLPVLLTCLARMLILVHSLFLLAYVDP
ncbi:hypothetical protein K438DRAFT_1830881 [Mycena galopus ATCC 62051]|nr:hypothetical protein K438DRAFT_1830881 [Mycena galopus ATCC 62051]